MADRPLVEELRRAHPLLDPRGNQHHPELYRLFYRQYAAIEQSDEAYNDGLDRLFNPVGMDRSLDANRIEGAYYLNEASRYVEALLSLLPRRKATRLRPRPSVADCNDLRELMEMVFSTNDPRLTFEASRKLYLAKLFFDVAHTPSIQRGDIHREYFEKMLQRELFVHTVGERDADIAFNIAADGLRIEYNMGPPMSNQEAWRFRVRELNLLLDHRPVRIHVYFYSCRSKREVLPYHYGRGQQVYELRAVEKWKQLSMRRDASIVSKMLRKGVNHPGAIPDILGAMFIVENQLEVEHLKLAILDIVGGPLKIRNIVDTLSDPSDRSRLNRHSGAGYRVYKGEVDVLYRARGSEDPPYSFTVELQLYTLETYLRTIHEDHYASHQTLKRRQFLEALAPLLFPEEIYGT